MEECPNETFINGSPEKCWKMVLQRLKQQIVGHDLISKQGLPILQSLESIYGLELFGFFSPPIIQVVLPPLTLNISSFFNARLVKSVLS